MSRSNIQCRSIHASDVERCRYIERFTTHRADFLFFVVDIQQSLVLVDAKANSVPFAFVNRYL